MVGEDEKNPGDGGRHSQERWHHPEYSHQTTETSRGV